MDKTKFKKFVESNLKEAFKQMNLKDAFKMLCENTAEFYSGTQVVFAERFTKRIEYIIGAGTETFMPQEKIELDERYVVFLQSFENVSAYEKDVLVSLFKLVVAVKR